MSFLERKDPTDTNHSIGKVERGMILQIRETRCLSGEQQTLAFDQANTIFSTAYARRTIPFDYPL